MPGPEKPIFETGRKVDVSIATAPATAPATVKERKPLFAQDNSIIPACDVEDIPALEALVDATADMEGIGGYKLGMTVFFEEGLKKAVEVVKSRTDKPVIIDYQKAGNDIPEMGAKFARSLKKAGADAAILFPFAGPATQEAWTTALQEEGLGVLVGAHMTHKNFLRSEGGYIANDTPRRAFELAVEMGVTDFVVPGNKPKYVDKYRRLFTKLLGEDGFTMSAPGFVDQGGDVSVTGKVAGKRWNAIVGGGIYKAKNMREAAQGLVDKIKRKEVFDPEEADRIVAEMNQQEKEGRQAKAEEILDRTGAVLDGHFVLRSGKHSDTYINKDFVYLHTQETEALCDMMADAFVEDDVDVVVGPALGGIVLSNNVARLLTEKTGKDVIAAFAEKDTDDNLVFTRGYDQFIPGKKVLVVEDILTSGGSAKKAIDLTESTGGEVVGLSVIANRNPKEVTSEALGVRRLEAMIEIDKTPKTWLPKDCPKCEAGIPVDNKVGAAKKLSQI